MRLRATAVACAALMLAFLGGCKDDSCTDCPGPGDQPNLATLWPHAEGTTWTYMGSYAEYPLPDGVGWVDGIAVPLPSMEDLHADLQAPPPGVATGQAVFEYDLALDGEVTTASGVHGQALTATAIVLAPARAGASAAPAAGGDRLLRLVARCRPDLRPALLDRLGLEEKDLQPVTGPLLLGGFSFAQAFAYEDSGYFAYGDLDTLHSWTYLQGGLEVGTEFSLQLMPSLTNDLWLHGRVWSVGTVNVNGREFANAVECMYVIDLSTGMVSGENGEDLGTFHGWVCGTIVYAPDVGPVAVRERAAIPPDANLWGGMYDYVVNFAGPQPPG